MTKFSPFNRKSTSPKWGVALLTVALLTVLAGCSQDAPAAQPPIENISVPTPTPPPTATPFSRATPPPAAESENGQDSTAGQEESEDGLLSGFLNENEDEEAGDDDQATVDPETSESSAPATVDAPTGLEPAEVTIDLQNGELNTWVEVDPPPGWRITQGLDGIVLAKEPELIPESSFILVRRWGNVVNLEDYLAYLPDAVEEPNSTVAFKLGGYDWEGVFVTNETNSYRAFFGVSNDVLPSFSLLVFVPGPEPLPGEEAISRETLLELWTFDVGDLNSILRRMAFY